MFTRYGRELAKAEPLFETDQTGAAAHAKACAYDAGIEVRMFGTSADGRRFSVQARSVQGAFFTHRAMWGLDSAWHIRQDGSRRLLFRC